VAILILTYIPFYIPIPDFCARIGVAILLLYKKIRFGYELRYIELTQGKYAIVSLEDYERINRYKWHILRGTNTFYAMRREKRKTIYMHNEILPPTADRIVDHIDHNGLNNSRGNLQLATRSQNACNRRKKNIKCSSKYKGVCFDKSEGNWISTITVGDKRISLGNFDNERDAAKAYDKAAKLHHGKFAALNFG
jgi:hypothetical protein